LLSLTNLPTSPYQFLDPAGVNQPARFYRAFMYRTDRNPPSLDTIIELKLDGLAKDIAPVANQTPGS
jgi:hypothetical protein